MTRRRANRSEAHVRVYGHELTAPAYRSVRADARALLIEFRCAAIIPGLLALDRESPGSRGHRAR